MQLLKLLSTAKVYNLEQPRYNGQPSYPSHRPPYNYFITRKHLDSYHPETKGPRTTAQGMIIMGDHSGTHIDAFCHQALDLIMHGGVQADNTIETPGGYKSLAAEHLPNFIVRGILLDVATYKGVSYLPNRYSITSKDLEETKDYQGTSIRSGDAILIRTGYDTLWHNTEEYLKYAGVGQTGSQWVREHNPSIFGIDQLSWDLPEELDSETGSTHWAHINLFVRDGITMIENMKLDDLARDRQYEFTFLCFPMKFVGATGSPVSPIALVEEK